jgi:hypothetical protein
LKEGLIQSEYLGYQIDEAELAEIITETEAEALRDYHRKVMDLIAVDDFAPEDIGRVGSRPRPVTAKPAAQKMAAKKKVARSKTASRKKAKSSKKKVSK